MLRVVIEWKTDTEHCLRFSVSDTGIGIPEAKQAFIFEAFSQAEASTRSRYGGTGLGLSTALGIVKGHGGFANVYSEVGKGTQFKIHLPAIASAQGHVSKVRSL